MATSQARPSDEELELLEELVGAHLDKLRSYDERGNERPPAALARERGADDGEA